METKKKMGIRHLGLWISAAMLLGLFMVYLGIAIFFTNHFLPGTTINGVNASGKDVDAVEQQIIQQINGYQLVIEGREEKEEFLSGEDIALKPVFDGTLQKELKKQNCFTWLKALFETYPIEVETMVDYDKDALKRKAKGLEMMDKSQMEKPEDAFISEYSKEEGYKIIPEEQGTTIKLKKFMKALKKTILNLQNTLSLEEADCYEKPRFTSESEEIKDLAETMNKYVGAAITYQFGEKQEVLDGETINQWIKLKENHELELSQEEVAAYVERLAETWNTAGRSKKLATSYGTEVTVEGGDYGWRINREKETEALTKLIKKGKVTTREPEYDKWANSRNGNDYGSTYVEVNLTAQHLFYYKNGELILETDFVSGNDSKNWSTPAGAYGLYYKERDKTLRGEDYATPVSYWMPFNGGVGFHDATWRRDFGGNYYKKNGSHGCVNMPFDAAKTLFENIEAGCAVLVYHLPGSESTKAKAQDAAATVVQVIGSLGDITLDSKAAVAEARNQYNGLSDTAKGYVSNYGTLQEAEAIIAQLEAEIAADQQAQAEAQPVIDAINGLAAQTITLEMKSKIEAIRQQYNQLSDAARGKVTNYGQLEEAERQIAELERQGNG